MYPPCLLCHNKKTRQYHYSEKFSCFECDNCGSVYKDPTTFPDAAEEKERYLKHHNEVDDKGYKTFVSPISNYIHNNFNTSTIGLDFGAGTGPVISEMLSKYGYNLVLYDPFFHKNHNALKQSYDFIVCCEVIEHFHNPSKEFQLLRNLLKPGGSLLCMTELLPKKEHFANWYYKNDITHVIFYSDKNLQWIQNHFRFSKVNIDKRLIVLDT